MADKHLYIFGDIGYEVRLNDVAKATDGITKEDNLIVHIHSQGGEVTEGFAIHDFIRSLGVNVETRIEGLCASIATVISLAGDTRTMTENSTFFIHNPWSMGGGDADEMERMASELRLIENRLASFYSKKTGQETETLLNYMKEETSFTAEQAMELGFIQEIVTGVKAAARIKEKPINKSDQSIMNQIEKKLNSMFASISNKLGIKNEFTETKAMVMELEDGSKINIVTESESPEVGNPVQLEDGTPASDGDYTLADGSVIRVEAGVISEVVAAMSDDEDEEMKALKAENETLKASVSELNAKLETYAKTVEVINAKLEQSYVAPTRNSFKAKKVSDEPKPLFTKDDLKTTPKTK
jgi:ATP-dependent protease ClpP protease subunit